MTPAAASKTKSYSLDLPAATISKPSVCAQVMRPISRLGWSPSTGVTTLLVEQNARAALETADYGYVLEMGEVALHGPAQDLARDPRVIDTYLGAARTHAGANESPPA